MTPLLPFGSTGHDSSRIIFGAAALGGMHQERADATIEQVRAAGVNINDPDVDTTCSFLGRDIEIKRNRSS